MDDLRKKIEEFNDQLELLHEDYKNDGCVEEAAGIGAVKNLWYKIFPEFDPR